MIIWSWNLRPLEHPCRQKGWGETGETALLMLSAFLETKKEVAQKSCICHFWDARDSVFCNCCFDLCLPDHKQAPYQSHPKVKKWSQELDMWASALTVSKTSASMQLSKTEALLPQASKNIKPYLRTVKSLSVQDLIWPESTRPNGTKDPIPSPLKKTNQLHQYL